MAARFEAITPVARIIAGSTSKSFENDMSGKPRAKPQYFIAVAIRKDDASINGLLNDIFQFGMQSYSQYPHIQARAQMWLSSGSQFAWKIEDGDHPKFAAKGHYKGHYVFKFTTTLGIRCIDRDNRPIPADAIKAGYFVDVAFNVAPNMKIDHTAGLYMNPVFVRLLAYGEEIVGGPAPEKVFTAPAPTMLPPGATMTPQAPGGIPAAGPMGAGPVPVNYQMPGENGYAAPVGNAYTPTPPMSATPAPMPQQFQATVSGPATNFQPGYVAPTLPGAPMAPAPMQAPVSTPVAPEGVTAAHVQEQPYQNGASDSVATASPTEVAPVAGFSYGAPAA
jgi:hypothetical protein